MTFTRFVLAVFLPSILLICASCSDTADGIGGQPSSPRGPLDASSDAPIDSSPDGGADLATTNPRDAGADSSTSTADAAPEFPSMQVVTSGPGEIPIKTLSIAQTECAQLSGMIGTWNFYNSPSNGAGGSLPEQLASQVTFSRVQGHPELLTAVEKPIVDSGSASGSLFAGGAHYIALWQFNGCTIITATEDFTLVFAGRRMSITDSNHINFFGFGGASARLEKID